MNRFVGIVLLVGAVALLGGCRTERSATEEPATQMVGAWSKADVINAEVEEVATKAVSLRAEESGEALEFQEVLAAQMQVVAGVNYRLTLRVEDSGKERTASAIVWKKLDGTCELTSWSWE